MPEPLPVSVVIPAYNRADLLPRALASIAAQTRPPAEVVVVDDASSDDTAAVAERLGARVVVHEVNQGETGARNTGLRAASQPWVATLDSDDEWLPGHLEELWAVRDGHVLAATAARACGSDPSHDRLQGPPGRRPVVLRSPAALLWPENFASASNVLFRRDLALAAGGYPVGVRHAGDLDLLVRLLEQGTGVVSPRLGAIYHQHEDQVVSGARGTMRSAHRDIVARYADRPWATRRVAERAAGAHAWDDVRAALRAGDRRAALGAAGRAAAHPERLVGLAGMLLWRARGRRSTSRVGRDGRPVVAVLPGASAPAGAAHVVDLRGRGTAGALAHLARRPAGAAAVASPLQALAVRAAGVRPVRAGRDAAA